MTTYVPIKVGSGKQVHAGRKIVISSRQVGRETIKINRYDPLCTVVNSHNINRHPAARPLAEGTPITCRKCLAKIEGSS